MMILIFFLSVIIVQRIAELIAARRNALKMFSLGAVEYDNKGYSFIVLMHIFFFISIIFEFFFMKRVISPFFPYMLVLFLSAQALRYWSISKLGIYWNTRIIVLKGSRLVKSGPYKFLKHPNYTAVVTEIALIPLMFSCYFTAVVFSVMNLIVLKRRIKIETEALLKNSIT
jgi:methyltransferase